MPAPSRTVYDTLIIGAGPAGLSTALGLGRIGRTCAVFSHGTFRNDGIEASHSVLGHDHIPPQKIWALGRRQIARYANTTFIDNVEITLVERRETERPRGRHEFVVSNEAGEAWCGRTLVLATGVKDVFPTDDDGGVLPGYADNWPRNIYQCLFCDGFERRTMPRGILCLPAFQPELAKVATQLLHLDPAHTSNVTVFANGDPDPKNDPAIKSALEKLAANGIEVDERKIVRLEQVETGKEEEKRGVYVHLRAEDGTEDRVFQGFVFHKPSTAPNAAHLIEQLGLEMLAGSVGEFIKTESPFQTTSVPGVFAAGDAGVFMTHVTNAFLTGTGAAGGISFFLNDWDDEVAMATYSKRKTVNGV